MFSLEALANSILQWLNSSMNPALALTTEFIIVGILMAGWASNNKYSLLGAMRSGAQIVSYELSVGLSIISIVVLSGSLQLSDIIASQQTGWWLFRGHIP